MTRFALSVAESFLQSLPPGAELSRVAFVPAGTGEQPTLVELPPSTGLRAVRVEGDGPPPPAAGPPPVGLELITIPLDGELDAELLTRVRDWVERGESGPAAGLAPRSLLMTLHGTQVCWAAGRGAVLASPERLAAVRDELVRAACFEAELGEIERTIGADWPRLEEDLPHAYEFNERSRPRRRQLRERFLATIRLRARLERITPFIEAPHVYPPTVASQVGERFRERTHCHQRLEWAGDQLAVHERVYELCGDRSSDFTHARAGQTLEWAIIVLLLTQIVLSLFEIMSQIET